MNPTEIVKEFEIRTGIKKAWMIALAGSMGINVLLSIGIASADRTHRETLIPPEITKSFWVEDTKVSASYLEQMGLFILRNALDVTSTSAEYQMKQILRYTHPSRYGELEKHFLAQQKRLARDKVSTTVAITGAKVFEDQQSVRFTGTLKTMVADKTVAEQPKTYEVGFMMRGGRIYLNELKELDAKGNVVSDTDDRTQ